MKHSYKDLTGKTFGRLTAISYTRTVKKRAYWLCKCSCGKIIEKLGKTLLSGLTRSCGCLLKEVSGQSTDITGKRFTFVVALKRIPNKGGRVFWLCKCDCGNYCEISAAKLASGWTKSCGCLRNKECSKRATARNKLMVGPLSPVWRHDLSKEDRANSPVREHNPKLYRWRLKVFKRDGFTCQCCYDDQGGNLEAHHIYSWADNPTLRFILSNGITLCEDCHKEFHKRNRYGNNNRKQLNEFLKLKLIYLILFYEYIFGSVDEVIQSIKKIDSGDSDLDLSRFKLLKPEFR